MEWHRKGSTGYALERQRMNGNAEERRADEVKRMATEKKREDGPELSSNGYARKGEAKNCNGNARND